MREFGLEYKTLIVALVVIVLAAVVSRVLRWLITKSLLNASGKVKVDPTKYKFFKNAVSFIIWMIALATLILLIPKLKALAITMFAGAGIMMVIIGLAAQQAFSNIVSGIFIVLFKPFRVGDMVKIGSLEYGIVEDITLRHTVINSFENKKIIIPNATVSAETIVNDNIVDSKICKWIEVGISYDSDIELAIKIIQEVSMAHPKCIDIRSDEDKINDIPQVVVRVLKFDEYSINLKADVWTDSPFHARNMHSDINKMIKKRFDKEGIEIPFPYRTIVYKKDISKN